MIKYVFATQREADAFKKHAEEIPDGAIDVVGSSAVDLGTYTGDDIVVNIGYCGGYKMKLGALVEPVYVMDAWTMEVMRTNTIFPIEHRICLTSDFPADAPTYEFAAIYDTELSKIASKPHKRIHAIKIVGHDFVDCGGFDEDDAWAMVADLVRKYVRE